MVTTNIIDTADSIKVRLQRMCVWHVCADFRAYLSWHVLFSTLLYSRFGSKRQQLDRFDIIDWFSAKLLVYRRLLKAFNFGFVVDGATIIGGDGTAPTDVWFRVVKKKQIIPCRWMNFGVFRKNIFGVVSLQIVLKKKAVDDIMGGEDAWANVDKTQVQHHALQLLYLKGGRGAIALTLAIGSFEFHAFGTFRKVVPTVLFVELFLVSRQQDNAINDVLCTVFVEITFFTRKFNAYLVL